MGPKIMRNDSRFEKMMGSSKSDVFAVYMFSVCMVFVYIYIYVLYVFCICI